MIDAGESLPDEDEFEIIYVGRYDPPQASGQPSTINCTKRSASRDLLPAPPNKIPCLLMHSDIHDTRAVPILDNTEEDHQDEEDEEEDDEDKEDDEDDDDDKNDEKEEEEEDDQIEQVVTEIVNINNLQLNRSALILSDREEEEVGNDQLEQVVPDRVTVDTLELNRQALTLSDEEPTQPSRSTSPLTDIDDGPAINQLSTQNGSNSPNSRADSTQAIENNRPTSPLAPPPCSSSRVIISIPQAPQIIAQHSQAILGRLTQVNINHIEHAAYDQVLTSAKSLLKARLESDPGVDPISGLMLPEGVSFTSHKSMTPTEWIEELKSTYCKCLICLLDDKN